MSHQHLIKELAKNYRHRPWWKNPSTLFLLWFGFHLVYFLVLGFLKADMIVLRSSPLYLVFQITGAALAGFLFIKLYRSQTHLSPWMERAPLLIVMIMVIFFFVENYLPGSIQHSRSFGFMKSDFNCFWHAAVSTVGPIVFFPFLLRNFFFSRPIFASVLMSFHLAFLAGLLNELKCPEREFWHLVLGHQTPVIGIALLLWGAITVTRRHFFVRHLMLEK